MNICSSNNFKTQESTPFNWGCFTQEVDKKSIDTLENKTKKIVLKIKKAKSDKRYRESHKAEISKSKKIHYRSHKAEIAKYNRIYYQNHKAQKAEYNSEYYQNHKSQRSKYNSEYYKKNKTHLTKPEVNDPEVRARDAATSKVWRATHMPQIDEYQRV